MIYANPCDMGSHFQQKVSSKKKFNFLELIRNFNFVNFIIEQINDRALRYCHRLFLICVVFPSKTCQCTLIALSKLYDFWRFHLFLWTNRLTCQCLSISVFLSLIVDPVINVWNEPYYSGVSFDSNCTVAAFTDMHWLILVRNSSPSLVLIDR